ncbi:hypothetical protein RHGRI_010352 [Rhododendron griersonianum]|uniref:Uncharacterized protein n=1 Tax=Rhododendron griersonianum TaxID=479676 RepID=A0AAV6KJB2_9ERIC|nr:hypothetical protein RHGRI_010352 [Rhododendron griersonianum]
MGSLVHMGLLPFLESLTFKFAETPQESVEEIETETYIETETNLTYEQISPIHCLLKCPT